MKLGNSFTRIKRTPESSAASIVPLRGTYTRDMAVMADGRICTSNNPLPVAALEGGVLQPICIDASYRAGAQPMAGR